MNRLALIAAIATLALPSAALAQVPQDEMSYPRITHCAAMNMLIGKMLELGQDKDQAEVKEQAETYISQAAALTLIAAAMTEKDTEQVRAEVYAQGDAMAQSLTDEAAAEALFESDYAACTEMGKAAYDAVQQAGES